MHCMVKIAQFMIPQPPWGRKYSFRDTAVFNFQMLTRLLCRPQPQTYPPVALNQYAWVNRTPKHFIYIYFKAL